MIKSSAFLLTKYLPVLCGLILLPSLLQAQPSAQYTGLIEKLMVDFETPGVVVAVFKEGEWTEYTAGVSNLETRQPITPNSVFNVASISKMLTAIAVMQLAEAGKIDLDAPVEKYLTTWRFPASDFSSSQVAARRIMNHSAGLSQEFGPGFTAEDRLLSLVDILSGKSDKRKPLRIVYEPGSKHMYSNLGFGLLQLLIEDVSKMSFEDYMQKNIFEPLQMNRSSFKDPLSGDLLHKPVTPYNYRLEPQGQERFVVGAAAGLLTSLTDLKRLLEAETEKDRLISKAGFDDMHRPHGDGFALGHIVKEMNDATLFLGHTGLGMGWNASFQFTPDAGHGIIVLTNGDNGYYIHNTLIGYWYYSITEKRIEACKIASDKKLNLVSLYLEISFESNEIDKSEFDAFEKQLADIRKSLKEGQFDTFRAQCKDMQRRLNSRIKNAEFLENFNGAFEAGLYWLDVPYSGS